MKEKPPLDPAGSTTRMVRKLAVTHDQLKLALEKLEEVPEETMFLLDDIKVAFNGGSLELEVILEESSLEEEEGQSAPTP